MKTYKERYLKVLPKLMDQIEELKSDIKTLEFYMDNQKLINPLEIRKLRDNYEQTLNCLKMIYYTQDNGTQAWDMASSTLKALEEV